MDHKYDKDDLESVLRYLTGEYGVEILAVRRERDMQMWRDYSVLTAQDKFREVQTIMKKITAFRLEGCPYCRQAMKALQELASEDEKYSSVNIEWIEENEHPEIAAKYDYYYVPAMFIEGGKVYEAQPSEKYEACKANVKRVLEEALE